MCERWGHTAPCRRQPAWAKCWVGTFCTQPLRRVGKVGQPFTPSLQRGGGSDETNTNIKNNWNHWTRRAQRTDPLNTRRPPNTQATRDTHETQSKKTRFSFLPPDSDRPYRASSCFLLPKNNKSLEPNKDSPRIARIFIITNKRARRRRARERPYQMCARACVRASERASERACARASQARLGRVGLDRTGPGRARPGWAGPGRGK